MDNYVRKIDELGRVVIPKEVRNKYKIKENENILISCDSNKINISKYSYLDNYEIFINELCEIIKEIFKFDIEVEDREKIIYSTKINSDYHINEEPIIKDSIVIGKVKIYSNNDVTGMLKFISRIITLFLDFY